MDRGLLRQERLDDAAIELVHSSSWSRGVRSSTRQYTSAFDRVGPSSFESRGPLGPSSWLPLGIQPIAGMVGIVGHALHGSGT
jgi:hypothetical protein